MHVRRDPKRKQSAPPLWAHVPHWVTHATHTTVRHLATQHSWGAGWQLQALSPGVSPGHRKQVHACAPWEPSVGLLLGLPVPCWAWQACGCVAGTNTAGRVSVGSSLPRAAPDTPSLGYVWARVF